MTALDILNDLIANHDFKVVEFNPEQNRYFLHHKTNKRLWATLWISQNKANLLHEYDGDMHPVSVEWMKQLARSAA